MTETPSAVTGVANGVPYLAVPPERPRADAPVVIAWHLQDAPRTEAAFAAALPLAGLDAWRIYLGLPLSGSRLPPGGVDEVMQLGMQDAVLNLQGPIARQGADEFPGALAELRDRLSLGNGPLALVGASMGGGVALGVLTSLPAGSVRALVLINALVQLRPAVEAMARGFGFKYEWGAESSAIADEMDYVARAGEIAALGPAVRLIIGQDDDQDGFGTPARELESALRQHLSNPDDADLVEVPGLAHALAEEPGVDAAPQTAGAAAVDEQAVRWLRRHLR